MREHSHGVRVTVYTGESDQVGHQPRYEAMLHYLRREGAAGATVTRGIAGFGANSHEVHSAHTLRLSLDNPVVLTWIDAPERVERLLPGLRELAGSGVITIDEIEIAAYGYRRLPHLRFDLPVRDVMTRDPAAVPETASVRQAIELLVGSEYRALPVVDPECRLVGIVSNQDLVERGGLAARVDLLAGMASNQRDEVLAALPDRQVQDVMTRQPASVSDDATLAQAVHVMTERRIKRLPVVDRQGKLVGILSRWYVLRAVGETFPRDLGPGPSGGTTVRDLMRSEAPTVQTTDPIEAVLDAVMSTRLNRAVVVDRERRVVGVLSDADIMRAVDPAAHPGLVSALMGRRETVPTDQKAIEFVAGMPAAVAPDTSIAEAARLMAESGHKILCVVDDERRLLGILDRADLLRAAGAALKPAGAETATGA